MKNLKTILLILAFGLISNGVFAQSKTIKADKKSINSTPEMKATPTSYEKQVEKPKQSSNTQPSQTYSPNASGTSQSQSTPSQPVQTTPTQPIKSSGNNNSIPVSSYPGKSKK